jgi:ectoine hydroxylase-related dioxygenase (phytanoyl-CoA dioxygenase family)
VERSGVVDANTLRRDGFVVLRSLVDAELAARIASTAGDIAGAGDVAVCTRPNATLVPLRWTSPAVSAVLGDSRRMQRVRSASNGTDLRWLTAYLGVKEPHSGPLPWHQDWWCWDHPISWAPAAPQVALLCYLDAAGPSRGGLRVLPGSHRSTGRLHELVSAARSDPRPDDPVMRDHPDQVSISTAAGDAVLVDYRLLHGTHEHDSPAPRSCLILNFAPDWRTLPPPIRAHLIQSWSLPDDAERAIVEPTMAQWLPNFTGRRRDLPLNRTPPVSTRRAASGRHP